MIVANTRLQFARTMLEVGIENERMVVMVGDISHGILRAYAEACPKRYFNIGILEPTMMSMGAGLARVGLIPVLHTIAPFLIERSFEQIKLDFCYHKLAGNIVTVGGTFDYSNLGISHHCYGDVALLRTLPGVQITCPSMPGEFDALFRQTYDNKFLTYFRVTGNEHQVTFAPDEIQFGKAIRVREGKDLTLIAAGPQLRTALSACEVLSSAGLDPEILYVHTIRPLDDALILASAKKTRRVLVVEEHMRSGGLGDDILHLLNPVPNTRVAVAAVPDRFITGYGTYAEHLESCGLTPNAVASLARRTFEI